jgi:hypothetical protein
LLLGVAWFGSQPAETHTLAEAIEVDPGATCLEESRLLEHVGRWLGRSQIDIRIRVEVHGDARRSDVASFRVMRGEGRIAQRTLDPAPAECADLHAGLAFAIALGIDASILGDFGVELEKKEPGQREPSAPPVVLDVAEPKPLPRPRRPTQVWLGVRAAGMLGLVSRASGGGELRLDTWFPSGFLLGVSGVVNEAVAQPLRSGQFRATGAAGRIDACYARDWSSTHVRFCGGVAAGAVNGRGKGFEPSQQDTVAWVWFAGGSHVRFPADRRVGLSVGVELVVPVLRPRFVLRDESGDRVATASLPPLGGILLVGPEFRLR